MTDVFRYSKGFGVVRYLLGEEHVLNVPNCVTGLVFYTLQFILGKHRIATCHVK